MNRSTRRPIKVLNQLLCKVTRRPEKKCANRHLNQYGSLLKKAAGTGASATVKILQNPQGSLYAVKIFQKRSKKSKNEWIKKLVSEYCISSVLSHPNIINTIDLVLDTQRRYCIIMEYCSGGDLYSWIKEEKLRRLSDINQLFKQLLCGAFYLHSLGVAHRDIKPENLLIQQVGQRLVLKITDFGEADVFREVWGAKGRLSDGVCGSMPYMAPEVFSLPRYNASQADVWSAAIVYSCMRLRGVPFCAANNSDPNFRLFRVSYDKRSYPALECLDKDSKHMLYDMMNPNPEKRFTIQDVLKLTWIASV